VTTEIKRPATLIATIVWKPFDQRFGDLQKKMERHRNFIIDEVRLFQTKKMVVAEEALVLERSRTDEWQKEMAKYNECLRDQANETTKLSNQLGKTGKGSMASLFQDPKTSFGLWGLTSVYRAGCSETSGLA
jgi:hypothetical protein